jgi:hypothetical protein
MIISSGHISELSPQSSDSALSGFRNVECLIDCDNTTQSQSVDPISFYRQRVKKLGERKPARQARRAV